MCMSRLHRVVHCPDSSRVVACDLDGREHLVSLLAYEGPPPEVGQWIVVHSGFALAPADPSDARAALSELRALVEQEGE